MKTLLVITPGSDAYDSVFNLVVAETGEGLASQLCSHAGYAMSDLYTSRQERIDEYKDRFGEVEVKFLEDTDISEEELIARNNKWFEDVSSKTMI